MALSEDIVKRIDSSQEILRKVYDELDPENYVKFYQKIWSIRAEMEYIVAAMKLLNNLTDSAVNGKWKKDFSDSLIQVRALKKVKEVFVETFEMYNKLESLENILDFYKICWMIKEKLTIILNVVKPKHKLTKEFNKEKNSQK